MAVDDSMTNSSDNFFTSINVKTNIVVDFDLDNFSSNKDSYLFNNCNFLSNDNHHKDNLDGGSNSESGTSLIILVKKRI